MITLTLPLERPTVEGLRIGDRLLLSGWMFAGRDAALPRLARLVEQRQLKESGIDLHGACIFHTAVSPAGVGPTSSNKVDIEGTMPLLSQAGVAIHLGKGRIGFETVSALKTHHSVFAVIPPVTALLESRIRERKVVAFHEEGMEALHLLLVIGFPCIVAAAHGNTLYKV